MRIMAESVCKDTVEDPGPQGRAADRQMDHHMEPEHRVDSTICLLLIDRMAQATVTLQEADTPEDPRSCGVALFWPW